MRLVRGTNYATFDAATRLLHLAPLSFDAAVGLSRSLLPNDAEPRGHGPEGNPERVPPTVAMRAAKSGGSIRPLEFPHRFE